MHLHPCKGNLLKHCQKGVERERERDRETERERERETEREAGQRKIHRMHRLELRVAALSAADLVDGENGSILGPEKVEISIIFYAQKKDTLLYYADNYAYIDATHSLARMSLYTDEASQGTHHH